MSTSMREQLQAERKAEQLEERRERMAELRSSIADDLAEERKALLREEQDAETAE